MKKSYLKSAVITFLFIFVTFGLYLLTTFRQKTMLSPGTAILGGLGFQSFLAFIIGLLVVVLVYFLIMSIVE